MTAREMSHRDQRMEATFASMIKADNSQDRCGVREAPRGERS